MPTVTSHNLQIGLQPGSLGVGKIFLHRRIRDEISVPQGLHVFFSIPIFQGEKLGFVVQNWCFRAVQDLVLCEQNSCYREIQQDKVTFFFAECHSHDEKETAQKILQIYRTSFKLQPCMASERNDDCGCTAWLASSSLLHCQTPVDTHGRSSELTNHFFVQGFHHFGMNLSVIGKQQLECKR